MKKFLRETFIFLLFVASIVCFYLSLTAFFASMLLNIICFFTAVFLLIQASGMVDKIKGFGPNATDNTPEPPAVHSPDENTNDAPTYEGDDEI